MLPGHNPDEHSGPHHAKQARVIGFYFPGRDLVINKSAQRPVFAHTANTSSSVCRYDSCDPSTSLCISGGRPIPSAIGTLGTVPFELKAGSAPFAPRLRLCKATLAFSTLVVLSNKSSRFPYEFFTFSRCKNKYRLNEVQSQIENKPPELNSCSSSTEDTILP